MQTTVVYGTVQGKYIPSRVCDLNFYVLPEQEVRYRYDLEEEEVEFVADTWELTAVPDKFHGYYFFVFGKPADSVKDARNQVMQAYSSGETSVIYMRGRQLLYRQGAEEKLVSVSMLRGYYMVVDVMADDLRRLLYRHGYKSICWKMHESEPLFSRLHENIVSELFRRPTVEAVLALRRFNVPPELERQVAYYTGRLVESRLPSEYVEERPLPTIQHR
jgi:hypothetical protein